MNSTNNYLIINSYNKHNFIKSIKKYLSNPVDQARKDIHRMNVEINGVRYLKLSHFKKDFYQYFGEQYYDDAIVCICQSTIGEVLIESLPFITKSSTKYSISSENTRLNCIFDMYQKTCTITKKMSLFNIKNPMKKRIWFDVEIIIDFDEEIVTTSLDFSIHFLK